MVILCVYPFSHKNIFLNMKKIGYKEIVGDPVFDVYEDEGLIQMEYWVDDDQVQENVDEVCLPRGGKCAIWANKGHSH